MRVIWSLLLIIILFHDSTCCSKDNDCRGDSSNTDLQRIRNDLGASSAANPSTPYCLVVDKSGASPTKDCRQCNPASGYCDCPPHQYCGNSFEEDTVGKCISYESGILQRECRHFSNPKAELIADDNNKLFCGKAVFKNASLESIAWTGACIRGICEICLDGPPSSQLCAYRTCINNAYYEVKHNDNTWRSLSLADGTYISLVSFLLQIGALASIAAVLLAFNLVWKCIPLCREKWRKPKTTEDALSRSSSDRLTKPRLLDSVASTRTLREKYLSSQSPSAMQFTVTPFDSSARSRPRLL
jgi:hypothetical protein